MLAGARSGASASPTDHAAKQAEKILEDPLLIPRISEGDIGEKLAQFAEAHPDILLTSYTRPHHHLFELVRRDFLIHGLVKNYKIGQLILESDGEVRSPVFSQSVSDLVALKLLQETEVPVRTLDSVIHRVQAFFIVLDCLGIARLAKDEPLWLYMKEFRERSAEHPTPVWAVKADQLLRKAAYKLQTERRSKFRKFSTAIKDVLEAVENEPSVLTFLASIFPKITARLAARVDDFDDFDIADLPDLAQLGMEVPCTFDEPDMNLT